MVAASDQCPFSRRALRLLDSLAIPFERVEPAAGQSVPQITIDGEFIGGYEALIHWHASGRLDGLRQA
jgi:glutaredoxin